MRYLNKHGIKNLRGSVWTTARISEMLRNPVYVAADIDVYNFYKSQEQTFITHPVILRDIMLAIFIGDSFNNKETM